VELFGKLGKSEKKKEDAVPWGGGTSGDFRRNTSPVKSTEKRSTTTRRTAPCQFGEGNGREETERAGTKMKGGRIETDEVSLGGGGR